MFGHKHRHDHGKTSENDNDNDISMNDNSPIILPTASTITYNQQENDISTMNYNNNNNSNNSNNSNNAGFIDPRLQMNMVTPINTGNTLTYSNDYNNNNGLYNLQQPQFNKFGSTTSLTSSINSEMTIPISYNNNNNSNNSQNLTRSFVSLLLEIYQDLSSDPTITPFDTTNPPSGILNRVGKLALDKSMTNNIDILTNQSMLININNNTLLSLIRHTLLLEIRKDGYLSRNVSLSSLPQQSIFPSLNNNTTKTISTTSTTVPMLRRTNTMDRVQNNITNITTGSNINDWNASHPSPCHTPIGGLGIGLGSSINLNNVINSNSNSNSNGPTPLSNINPLLTRSLSRTSSPLATKPRNYKQ